jgi:hypothetical protein
LINANYINQQDILLFAGLFQRGQPLVHLGGGLFRFENEALPPDGKILAGGLRI